MVVVYEGTVPVANGVVAVDTDAVEEAPVVTAPSDSSMITSSSSFKMTVSSAVVAEVVVEVVAFVVAFVVAVVVETVVSDVVTEVVASVVTAAVVVASVVVVTSGSVSETVVTGSEVVTSALVTVSEPTLWHPLNITIPATAKISSLFFIKSPHRKESAAARILPPL